MVNLQVCWHRREQRLLGGGVLSQPGTWPVLAFAGTMEFLWPWFIWPPGESMPLAFQFISPHLHSEHFLEILLWVLFLV